MTSPDIAAKTALVIALIREMKDTLTPILDVFVNNWVPWESEIVMQMEEKEK